MQRTHACGTPGLENDAVGTDSGLQADLKDIFIAGIARSAMPAAPNPMPAAPYAMLAAPE